MIAWQESFPSPLIFWEDIALDWKLYSSFLSLESVLCLILFTVELIEIQQFLNEF